jgi:hypothetical protein
VKDWPAFEVIVPSISELPGPRETSFLNIEILSPKTSVAILWNKLPFPLLLLASRAIWY